MEMAMLTWPGKWDTHCSAGLSAPFRLMSAHARTRMSLTAPEFSLGTDGLLPAIAQDATTKQVLMMAWMNRDAYAETIRTGMATYYSRSRKKLWRKGEESGHRQRVLELRVDCDADTILLLVEQTGAACHEGYASCFFRKYEDGTFAVDQPRLIDPAAVYHR
jgi:phosphoribosyl-AMP cyclohydrolase